ncbi:hypothetical protein JW859_03995 [bacterium]|nr:hypothetical protein [bacterium]
MKTRTILLAAAAVLMLLVLVFVFLFSPLNPIKQRAQAARLAEGTNLGLDVRFTYNADLLTPAPFDARAEYPLRLDGDTFSFYGKRIRGLGAMLERDPAPLLYDFVGSQHVEAFEQWFGLEQLGEPLYEDAQIGGRLGLHQVMVYQRTAQSRGWPSYFPKSVTEQGEQEAPATAEEVVDRLAVQSGVEVAYIEGWVLFTDSDLFFFQAISPRKLSGAERQACTDLLDSMQFDVLLGSPEEEPAAEAAEPAPAAEGEDGTASGDEAAEPATEAAPPAEAADGAGE